MAPTTTQIHTSFNFPLLHQRNPSMTFWDQLTEDEKRSSVDRTCSREFRDGSAWEAAGRVKEKWDEDVYPNLKAFLNEKHKDLNPTSRKMAIYNIVCWMVGKEWHLSHPATVFVCGAKKVAKRALKQIECFLKLGNSGFRAYTHIATISLNCGASGQDPSGKIGFCGTLVNVGNFREAFERQTTVGGVVHINGYYYCMTAAHPFLGGDEDCDDGDDDDSDAGNDSFGEASEVPNNSTIEKGDLTADRVYRDSLHSLGAIPYSEDASNRKSFLSERFDWALLKISDECEPGLNQINVPSGILIPWRISSTSPKTPLWAATGTHQTVEIQSTPTLSGICLDNSGILDVWSLKMMSYPGDSGSWVVDPHDDSIVAIVMARCEALNVTYALPARDVFNDIARNIGETIDLMAANKESLLTLATKLGKADLVEELLRAAIDLNSKDERVTAMCNNALRAASTEGHDKIVQLLLDNGADVNALGGSSLSAASEEGHIKVVQLLLNHGADVNALCGSSLWAASAEGHDKIVQLLLNHGADVNALGGSSLRAASAEGHDKIVQLLLNHGADVNALGGSSLRAASAEGHDKIVQLLLEHGADVNALGGSSLSAASEEGHIKVVQLLLNHGADINALGGSALRAASKEGHDKIVQLLLEHGADVNAQGGSALLAASEEGHIKVVQLLLNHGADINALGGSSLRAASAEGHDKIVQLLLEHGADANAQGGSALLNRPADLAPARNPEAHQSASHRHPIYTPMSGVGSDHTRIYSTSEQSSSLLEGGSTLLNNLVVFAPTRNRVEVQSAYLTHVTSEQSSPPLETLRNRKAYSIRGESRGAYGPPLDWRYQVQRPPGDFFVVGRVFAILWHEGRGQQGAEISDGICVGQSNQSQFTRGRFGEENFSGIRRMVVVKAMGQCAWCVPITTYGGKGLAKPGVDPAKHAIVYMRGSVPTRKADEPRMTKEPLEVEPVRPGERLDEMSRLNFGKVYTVEYNVKVRHVGMISRTSVVSFRSYVNSELRLDI